MCLSMEQVAWLALKLDGVHQHLIAARDRGHVDPNELVVVTSKRLEAF